MLRAIVELARFFENYRYYRHLGMQVQEAWHMAKITLPE